LLFLPCLRAGLALDLVDEREVKVEEPAEEDGDEEEVLAPVLQGLILPSASGRSCRRGRRTRRGSGPRRTRLRALADQAGVTPDSEFDTTWTLEYPDAETLSRAMVAVAGSPRSPAVSASTN
jgi:hypothetical protein